ncbi:DUF1501 domain-containing protein [Candidatus Binatia bacterium]|nr:DUF1501 domain-containing protein [Candidatus Binatia bacterium]
MVTRREFFRYLAAASAATAGFALSNPLRPRLRMARAAVGKTLVVVFQRGGCDGLNTVIPYGDPNYAGLRPTIGIAPPSAGDPASAVDLDGFFGLHPGLAALAPIHAEGHLAVLPAVQYPDASQSHFDSQLFIESAAVSKTLDGWLNRHLVTVPQPAALRAVGFGAELPDALRGQAVVSAFNDITDFTLGLPDGEEDVLLADLGRIYSQQPDDTKAYRTLVQNSGRVVINDLAVLSEVDPRSYVPANGAVYPNSTFGTQLRQVAQLVKVGLGLEIAALSIGGWDTHTDQGGGQTNGQQSRRHQDFARGIAALYADLGPMMQDVVVLTMTEFGRTARENDNRGTDHGHAGAWFVAGHAVRGGMYGAWPGLGTAQMVRGRYLDHSLDFRDVMGDVLTRHMGNTDLATLLPGHTYTPVGFMA